MANNIRNIPTLWGILKRTTNDDKINRNIPTLWGILKRTTNDDKINRNIPTLWGIHLKLKIM